MPPASRDSFARSPLATEAERARAAPSKLLLEGARPRCLRLFSAERARVGLLAAHEDAACSRHLSMAIAQEHSWAGLQSKAQSAGRRRDGRQRT